MQDIASSNSDTDEVRARQRWLGALASAPQERLRTLWDAAIETVGGLPDYRFVRAPEIGLVMTRGRMGGTGEAFNLTEMTVTRCSVRLPNGTLGHGYVAGRTQSSAEIAAVCDALLQSSEHSETILSEVIEPLIAERAALNEERASKAAATRVEFFTMARGDNE